MKPAEKELLAGGQAVLEGVMMKLPRSWAVTVRLSNGGFVSRSGPHVPWMERWPVLKLPLLRGVATLFSMMGLGMRALFFSSDVMARDLEQQEQEEKKKAAAGTAGPASLLTLANLMLLQAVADGPDGTEADDEEAAEESAEPAGVEASHSTAELPDAGGMSKKELALSITLAAGMFLLLFKALPLGTAWLAAKAWPALGTPLGESIISGVALVAIFVGYLALMSFIPDIRRVFQYHGAEHKVVYLHEARKERTVDNAREYSTLHPRCGTSFMFFVVVTSIIVWALFPVDGGFLAKFGMRLALFPLILGLSFELIRLSARHRDSLFFRILMAPGLWSQRITTKPPDDGMLEVSLNSLALAEKTADAGQAAGD